MIAPNIIHPQTVTVMVERDAILFRLLGPTSWQLAHLLTWYITLVDRWTKPLRKIPLLQILNSLLGLFLASNRVSTRPSLWRFQIIMRSLLFPKVLISRQPGSYDFFHNRFEVDWANNAVGVPTHDRVTTSPSRRRSALNLVI